MTPRHPATEHLRGLLIPNPNLSPALRTVAAQVQALADEMVSRLGDGPELSMGLRKLLEAKDCFVRQALLDEEVKNKPLRVGDPVLVTRGEEEEQVKGWISKVSRDKTEYEIKTKTGILICKKADIEWGGL